MPQKPKGKVKADVLYKLDANTRDPLLRLPPRLLYIGRHQLSGEWRVEVDSAQYYKLSYFQEGRATIIINKKRYAGVAGDVFLYKPHVPHFGESVKNHAYKTYLFTIDFADEEFHHGANPKAGVSRFSTADNWKLKRILEGLVAESQKKPGNSVLLKSLLVELYAVLQELSANALTQSGIRKSPLGYKAALCLKAKAYMEKHHARRVLLKEIADHVSMSVSRFCHIFKEYTQVSPIEYLIQVRLDHAKALLKGSSKSITAVAFETGFSDVNYFTRKFKQFENTTPSRYRST